MKVNLSFDTMDKQKVYLKLIPETISEANILDELFDFDIINKWINPEKELIIVLKEK